MDYIWYVFVINMFTSEFPLSCEPYAFLNTILYNTFHSRGLYFRVNSRETSDAKIKSWLIISYVGIIEQEMTNRKSKVP